MHVRHWLREAELTFYDRIDALRRAVLEGLGGDTEDRWIWVRDATEDWVVYEDSGSGSPNPGLYQVGYTIDDAGAATLAWPAVEVEAHTIYEPVTPESAPVGTVESASIAGDFVPLVESAVRADGTVPIKIMSEGWGTSGYYPAAVIKRDGPKVFGRGAHAYWDHPTTTEAKERPERSLRDLAGVLESAAYWDETGTAGAGLYGNVHVFEPYRDHVTELAEHIGMSIRGLGKGHYGDADGRTGLIIDEIVAGLSVDFVTAPGAGGKVLSLFESARGARPGPTPKPAPGGDPMNIETVKAELTEAQALGAWAAAERDQARTELGRERTARLLREAADHTNLALVEAKLPDIAKARIVAEVCANPPASADGGLDRERLNAQIGESSKKMAELLGALTPTNGSGTVVALGESGTPTALTGEQLEAQFRALGLSEAAAKHAAAGR